MTSELDRARDYDTALTMMNAKGEKEDAALKHIQEVTERRLAQLILARFLLLKLLVQEARELTSGLQQREHRRLWVLLQVQPQIFHRTRDGDIFTDLTQLLRYTSTDDLKRRIKTLYNELSDLREKVYDHTTGTYTIPLFFCVLDEVQVTTSQRVGEFRSSDKVIKPSILRQIWISWTRMLGYKEMRLVRSGTGIDRKALEGTLKSTGSKPKFYQVVHETGAFDEPEAQKDYIKRYVPALNWSDPLWEQFLIRAWTWLRGRQWS